MDVGNLSLSALLSQALVAFTIEFDNEFERQIPHRTAISRALCRPRRGVWLSSQVMWSNFMQFVTEEGRTVAEIETLARTTRLPLAGMERWGYITVKPDPADNRPKPPSSTRIVRATTAGLEAQEIWRPLAWVIEQHWQTRFGAATIMVLRDSLTVILNQTDAFLPNYLPIVSYGLWSKDLIAPNASDRASDSSPDLSILLARVLLVFAMEFEDKSRLSLAICANVLRVLGEESVRVRDIPILTGISKEATAVSVGYLEREGYLTLGRDSEDPRAKSAALTPKGAEARITAAKRVETVEQLWSERYGSETIGRLKHSLQSLYDRTNTQPHRLAAGFTEYPDGWRFSKSYLARTSAMIRDPAAALPRFPIVSHRGGYLDGS